jgi:putative redox protein
VAIGVNAFTIVDPAGDKAKRQSSSACASPPGTGLLPADCCWLAANLWLPSSLLSLPVEATMTLLETIKETQETLRAHPDQAVTVFSAGSRQVEGLRSETKIRQFCLTIDEPPALGGSDAGPNPVELVLAALASCQEITYRAYATALGVPLDSVSVKLEGSLDLRGFFAIKDDVRSGFSGIRGTVTLISPADPEVLAKLKQIVDAHCPVLDMLRNPVPVDLELASDSVAVAAE